MLVLVRLVGLPELAMWVTQVVVVAAVQRATVQPVPPLVASSLLATPQPGVPVLVLVLVLVPVLALQWRQRWRLPHLRLRLPHRTRPHGLVKRV